MGGAAGTGFLLDQRGDRLEGAEKIDRPPAEPLRVGLLGPGYPLRGGISQYLALLYRALESYAQVRQFSLIRQYPSFLFPGKTQRDESVEPLRVPVEPVLDLLAPWQWRGAGRKVAAWRPDALVYKWWLPFMGPGYAAVLSAVRKAGAQVVMIADNLVPHEKRPFDHLFTRLILKRTDLYIVQSESVEEDLHHLVPGARYRRVPHPVYVQYASEQSRDEARAALGIEGDLLLFFGFVRRYKGLDTLIEAMPHILQKRDATLIVAGEFYEPVEPYRQQVAKLGLTDRVRFLDRYLPDEEVRVLFAAADACVLPYRSATQSGVIQVAYAADCPVITTRVGGLPEFVAEGESGYLVPPGDPAALAGAVERFYEQGGRSAFEPGVRRQAKRYSWEALAEAIVELIEEGRGR
jgi:glycosyltransferase involved in cell wall biosynthesis